MSRFIDEYLPDCTNSYNALSGPGYSTELVAVDSGAESVNQRWNNPLFRFRIPRAVRNMETMFMVRDHFMVMRGRGQTFPFRDPLDFASVNPEAPGVEPTISATDQVIGTGTGTKTQFQLVKTYTVGGSSYARNIHHPVVASVLVSVNGSPMASGWTVSRSTGMISFDSAPSNGAIVRAGYYFDVEVRYDHDEFDAIAVSYYAGGFADLELVEVRIC